MPDDPSKRGKPDRSRISFRQHFEKRDWCKRLGCTQAALREAIKAVGPMAADVKKFMIQRIEKA